jgi:hypothetical protein
LNFDIAPYHDDFDPDKNFYRILFKPGGRVQTRELNQLQTTMQDQVSRFAGHIFEHGSVVEGGEQQYDASVNYVKLAPTYNGTPIDLSQAEGRYLKFVNNSITYTGLIKKVVSATVTDPPTLIITQIVGSTFNPPNNQVFDVLTDFANSSSNVAFLQLADTTNQVGKSSLFSVSNGTYFIVISDDVVRDGVAKKISQGFFINYTGGSAVVGKYTNMPDATVGFRVDESIVTSAIDSSLNDNSQGSPNFAAPGADRYKISLVLESRAYDSTNEDTFVTLAKVKGGVLQSQQKYPVYSDIMQMIERRTSDESGNYTVVPFNLKISETSANDDVFIGTVSPGKAYVKGKEIEYISSTGLSIPKSRDTESVEGFDIQTFYGNYITINSPSESWPNFNTPTLIEFHSDNVFSNNSLIGTAFLKNLEYLSGDNTSAKFSAFIFGAKIGANTDASFTQANSIVIPSAANNYATLSFRANVDSSSIVSGNAIFSDTDYDTLVFPIPQNYVASISSASYDFRRVFKDVSFSAGAATISTLTASEDFVGASGGEVPNTLVKELYQVIVKTASGPFSIGEFVPLDVTGRSVTIPTVAPLALGTATINVGCTAFTTTADIIATIDVTGDARRTKTLVSNAHRVLLSVNTGATYSLLKSDVYQVKGVYHVGAFSANSWNVSVSYTTGQAVVAGSNVYIANTGSTANNPLTSSNTYWVLANNKISEYSSNNGQTDNYYDHGSIIRTSGANVAGNTVVVFDYFTHSGGKGFFDVQSYPVDYADIPSYTTSKRGQTISLRDALDFRCRRTDDNANTLLEFDTLQIPRAFTTVDADYSYYLRRIDKIVLDNKGFFGIVPGKSAYVSPPIPPDLGGAMTLFILRHEPYGLNEKQVEIRPINNRRYTMKEIGSLDRRLSAVEYYTALNTLEQEVEAKKIYDTNDAELFKNGYLVDSFAGHSVGDVVHGDYKCSIDFTNKEMRAPFTVDSYYFDYVGASKTGFFSNNNIIMLPFTETAFAQQTLASKVVNLNEYNTIAFRGALVLSPDSDVWVDTVKAPDVVVNEEGANDAWLGAAAPFTTEWNAWETTWTGSYVSSETVIGNFVDYSDPAYQWKNFDIIQRTYTNTTTYGRAGIQVRPETTITTSRGTKVINTSVIPWTRSRDVYFEAYGLMPNTLHFMSINLVDITAYVRPWDNATTSYKLLASVTGTWPGSTADVDFTTSATRQWLTTKTGSPVDIARDVYADIQTDSGAIVPVAALGTGTVGTLELMTNENGYVKGAFKIPNYEGYLRFPTGQLRVVISNRTANFASASSWAEAMFYAQGTLNTSQETFVSLRYPKKYGDVVYETASSTSYATDVYNKLNGVAIIQPEWNTDHFSSAQYVYSYSGADGVGGTAGGQGVGDASGSPSNDASPQGNDRGDMSGDVAW